MNMALGPRVASALAKLIDGAAVCCQSPLGQGLLPGPCRASSMACRATSWKRTLLHLAAFATGDHDPERRRRRARGSGLVILSTHHYPSRVLRIFAATLTLPCVGAGSRSIGWRGDQPPKPRFTNAPPKEPPPVVGHGILPLVILITSHCILAANHIRDA